MGCGCAVCWIVWFGALRVSILGLACRFGFWFVSWISGVVVVVCYSGYKVFRFCLLALWGLLVACGFAVVGGMWFPGVVGWFCGFWVAVRVCVLRFVWVGMVTFGFAGWFVYCNWLYVCCWV